MQNFKKSVKIKVYNMRQSTSFLPFLQLAKVPLIALGATAKGYRMACRANGKLNSQTACNADQVSNTVIVYCWAWDTYFEIKDRRVLILCLPFEVFIPMKAFPTIQLSSRSNLVRLPTSVHVYRKNYISCSLTVHWRNI